jgi:hypothetical protein
MIWLGYFIGLLLLLLAAMTGWRTLDHRSEQTAWKRLLDMDTDSRQSFDPAIVADLPEPARRYFNYTIQAGTLLSRVVEIEMTGELGLGTKDAPNYQPMRARQILSPPHGFIWSLKSGAISGSEGALPEGSWTRFWLFKLIPVARVSGPDHQRSSFGRLVAESVFWAPASMLPGDGVSWEPLGENSARVTMRNGTLAQAIDVHVDDEGAPVRVVFQRWSDANPGRTHQFQPFGGDLSEFRDFQGYRLPTRVLAGNHYGTPDYFPFFKARVTAIRLANGATE